MRMLAAALAALIPGALGAAQPGEVVFSELMWMGSSASNADEWIELANRTDQVVDLAGWTIARMKGDSEEVMLRIEAGAVAPAKTFVIANYAPDNDRSMLATEPDLVDASVSLPNSKLDLRLYDGDPESGARLIDRADDGTGAPLAGDSQLKQSMVRIHLDGDGSDPASWATAEQAIGWQAGATELGTPGSLIDVLSGMPAAPEETDAEQQADPPADEPAAPGDTTSDSDDTAVQSASWAELKRLAGS